MQIYIPSRGRAANVRTLAALPKTTVTRSVTLVVPKNEVVGYQLASACTVIGQPPRIRTIAAKRAWIVQQHFAASDKPMLMMDDDLALYHWIDGKHQRAAIDDQGWRMFWSDRLPSLFKKYAAVSLGTKAFALPGTVRDNYHMGFAFGFTKEAAACIKWNRVNFYEDIDYTLQLLRSGKRIAVTYEAVVQQYKACAPGGCDAERSMEAMAADLGKLIRLHPGIIKRKQATATHPQANTRISWRTAAKEGGLI